MAALAHLVACLVLLGLARATPRCKLHGEHAGDGDVGADGEPVRGSCLFGDGADCIYQCHCQESAACNAQSGECQQCKQGTLHPYSRPNLQGRMVNHWDGPGCQVGNVAYQKKVEQIGTANNRGASLAVDGDMTDSLDRCSDVDSAYSTNSQDRLKSAWWHVDLESDHVVQEVEIIFPGGRGNSDTYRRQLEDVFVLVGNTPEDKWSMSTCGNIKRQRDRTRGEDRPEGTDGARSDGFGGGSTVTVTCKSPLVGRYVFLAGTSASRDHKRMTLCEVLVTGYKFEECPCGKFGPGCLKDCNCESNDCNIITGRCYTRCKPGWKGEDCQKDCPNGTWGPGCTKYCQCKKEGELCFKVDGYCPSGCMEGTLDCPTRPTPETTTPLTTTAETTTPSTTTTSLATTTMTMSSPATQPSPAASPDPNTSSPALDGSDQKEKVAEDGGNAKDSNNVLIIKDDTVDWRMAFIIVSAILFLVCIVLIMLAVELLCRRQKSNYTKPDEPAAKKPEYEKPPPQYHNPDRYQGLQYEEPTYAQLDQNNIPIAIVGTPAQPIPPQPRPSSLISTSSHPSTLSDARSYNSCSPLVHPFQQQQPATNPMPMDPQPLAEQSFIPMAGAIRSHATNRPMSLSSRPMEPTAPAQELSRNSYLPIT